MRIGMFCDVFLPESKAAAVRLYHIADTFSQDTNQVTVHTSSRQTKSFRFKVKKNIAAAPSSTSTLPVRFLSEVILGVECFFRILFCRYNLILISSPPFFTSLFGIFACNIRGIPYILDVRDEYPEVYFTAAVLDRTSFAGRVMLAMERCAYNKAMVIATVTEGICSRIRTKVAGDKVYLLRNGFDQSIFRPGNPDQEKFTVVFHGNIGKFQNPALIVKLAELAHNRQAPVRFLVLGEGNNDAILKKCDLPNLEYLGAVEYEKIPEIISKAHIGISFRSADIISINSFPVKLYEYIGVGLPVIVVPLSEAGEFVEQHKVGFQFSGLSPEPILSKIIELASNESYFNELKRNVISIRDTFSRDRINNGFYRDVKNRLLPSA